MTNEIKSLTVKEEPPAVAKRAGRWTTIADECRNDQGTWRRVAKPFASRNAAQQVASNIRSTGRRKKSMNGFNANEKWETAWGESPKAKGTFHVWLRFVGEDK